MSEPRKIALFDIDGTLFRWQLYHEIVFALKKKGFFSPDAGQRIDTAFAAWNARELSFDEYEMTVIDALMPHLPEIPVEVFEETAHEVAEKNGNKIYVYTKRLLSELREKDYLLVAISGSQQEVAELFAKKFGFDDCIGSLYERDGGHFTGNVLRFVPGNKDKIVREYIKSHNLTLADSYAIGDSEGDTSMLAIVDNPIAFNPAGGLLETAIANRWKIVIERKNVAYTLETNKTGDATLTHFDRY